MRSPSSTNKRIETRIGDKRIWNLFLKKREMIWFHIYWVCLLIKWSEKEKIEQYQMWGCLYRDPLSIPFIWDRLKKY